MTFIEKLGVIFGLPTLLALITADVLSIPWTIIAGIMKITGQMTISWLYVFLPLIIISGTVFIFGLIATGLVIYVALSSD